MPEEKSGDVFKRRFDVVNDKEDAGDRQNIAAAQHDVESTSGGNGGSTTADTIANHVLGDQPAASAKDDRLGFAPYVAAVAAFLTDPSTKIPLTLSVEGLWGSGKSSFMLQLQEALRKRGKTKIVSFNAWQYSADEGLWAAFIHEFDAKLNRALTPVERVYARIRLVGLRLSWQEGFQTAKALLWLLASFFATAAILLYLFHGGIDAFIVALKAGKADEAVTKTIALVGGAGGSLAAALIFLNQLRALFKSPASIESATRIFSRPNYASKLPLIRQITEDFNSLVKAYAGEDNVYVFIDDLDRCEYSKAAELMQALLMLLSSAPKIALIVGLDRQKVAAATATKQEKLLPYLYGVPSTDVYKYGLEYGQSFIEKFIQLSYILPTPGPRNMKAMINSDAAPPDATVPPSQKSIKAIEIVTGKDDSRTLNRMIDMADSVFEHNPRNVKQFVNMFRLQAFIANETGLFGSDRVSTGGLTIPQLGKFVLLNMRWPQFIAVISSDPELINTIEAQGESIPQPSARLNDPKPWTADRHLVRLLTFGIKEYGKEYSLAGIDFARLNEIVPARVKTAAADPRAAAANTGEHYTTAASESTGSHTESEPAQSGDFPKESQSEDFVRRPGSGGRGAPSNWGKTPQEPPPAA
jgi:KAP family P-loop domain